MKTEIMRKLIIENVLMDVDGTMTEEKRNQDASRISPHEILVELLIENRNISRKVALQLIKEAGDTSVICLFDLLDKLEISKEIYWDIIRKNLKNSISIPEDTVYFIKDMKAKGIKLFSATTNSRMMTLLKMSISGLASIDGSSYMAGYFSGNSFNDPSGKFSENFFPSIMKYGKFDPTTTMMIGNEVESDLKPAFKSGIKNIVIVNRTQPEPIIYTSEGMFVNSLRVVSEIL